MKQIIVAVAALLVMAACGTKQDKSLEGAIWKLETMEGIPAEAINAEPDFFTITFNKADSMVAGRTNCNRFFGKYTIKGRQLKFEHMGMTRMACPDMQYEDIFVKMIDEIDHFDIKSGVLTFYDDKKAISTFKELPLPVEKK